MTTSPPSTPAKAVGDDVLAADWNAYVQGGFSWLLSSRPLAQAYQSATQTLTTGVFAALTFTAEVIDRDGQHSTSSNTSRLTLGTCPGRYWVFGRLVIAGNATGTRWLKVLLNGSSDQNGVYAKASPNASDTAVDVFGLVQITNASDYVELLALQNSGGNLATVVSGAYACTFGAVWLGL